jgi:sporulation protein YlmC with PRC-barrel domain
MSSSGYLKREELIGKSVISKNAQIIGTVLDLAVSTDGRLAIQVQKKTDSNSDSTDLFIGADQIQAVGDVILLKSVLDSGGATSSFSSSTASQTQSTNSMPIPAPSPPPPPGMTPQSKTCQKCGYVNSPNAKFCIKCGASLMS